MLRAWHQRGETEVVRGAARQVVAALAHPVPGTGPLPFDRGRNGQIGGRVACALLLVTGEEARIVAFVAPAEDERMHVALQLAPHVEKAGALRRAQPFVT